MKMKLKFSLLLVALPFSLLQAQKVTINWGEESKTELVFGSFVNGQGSDMIKLVFDEDRSGFFGRNVTLTPILTRYDEKLNPLNVKTFEADEKGIKYDGLLSVKGKLFLFTRQYDKESKSTSFFTQRVNIKTLNTEGALLNLGTFDANSKSSQSTSSYELSKDSSKVLMFGLSAYSKKENEKYYLGVFDSDMKKMWAKTVELPYKDKYVEILDQIITNEGKVGVLIKHYDQEVSRESVRKDGAKVPSYKTKFLFYDKDNASPKEYVLELGDKYIHSLQLTEDNSNTLTLFGMYKQKQDGYVNGYFTTAVDKSTSTAKIGALTAFPEDLVTQIKIDKQGSDKEKDPGFSKWFKLVKIVARDDNSKDYILEYGSAVLVTVTTNTGTGGFSSYSYWEYNDGDIIDINIKQDGKTIFARVPKMQSSKNFRMYSKGIYMPYKDKLLVFYNDDDDNIDRDINKKPDPLYKFNKSVFVMAEIDSKGNVTRNILFRNRDNKLTTATNECHVIDKNRIGLYAQKLSGLFSKGKDMIGYLEVK
jgi:hypothetical protein